MRRIYSSIDSENIALVEQSVRRDPIFHETTPSIAPRPVCSAAFPTLNSLGQILSQFGFIWLGEMEFGY
jgi:hypothetical protein